MWSTRVRWTVAAVTLGLAGLAVVLARRDPPLPALAPPDPTRARARNAILVVLDTTRADAMGFAGYHRPLTPALDAFAARGVVFDRAYADAPWTMPSVASMFTSLLPDRHGISDWGQPLPTRHATLPELLRAAGFDTRAVVSHHAFDPEYQFDQGFGAFDWSVASDERSIHRSTANEVTTLGLAAIDAARASGRPFFTWIHYFDAHWKYLPHEGLDFGDTPRDRYDGEIAWQDQALGQLLDGVVERGLLETTAVVVLGDHGEEFQEHGRWQHTRQLYEESVRIPMVWVAPGLAPGRVSEVVPEIDLAPTLLALLGMDAPPVFQGKAMGVRDVGSGWTLAPAADGEAVLETMRFTRRQGLVTARYKLIEDLDAKTRALYDLEADPGEQTDLAASRPDVADELAARLAALRAGKRAEADRRPLGDDLEWLKSLGYVEEEPEGSR